MSDDHAPNLDWSQWNYLVTETVLYYLSTHSKKDVIIYSELFSQNIQIHFDRMIIQVFRIHIINDIVSKPRVDTTMNRN